MIVYSHHSFFDKPAPPPKPARTKSVPAPKPPKVKVRKPRNLDAERVQKRAYYQKHKDEIKIRRLRKDASK